MKRLLVLVAVVLALGLQPAFAANPVIHVSEAHAFRNVLESDDLLVIIRYELPVSDWRSATYMYDHTCDDEDDYSDNCWISLYRGVAQHILYDGPQATGVARALQTPGRVGHGLSGLYLEAGHGLTWGDSTYETCLEGDALTFTPVPYECSTLSWHTSATVADTPGVMDDYLIQMGLNLEEQFPRPVNTFVDGGKITNTGDVFFREAFTYIMSTVPDAFWTSVTRGTTTDVAGTPTPSALSSAIDTDAQSTDLYTNASRVAGEYGGVNIGIFTGIMTLLIGVVMGAFATSKTAWPIGMFLTGGIVTVGMWQGFIPVAPVFIALAVIVVIAAGPIFARLPSS